MMSDRPWKYSTSARFIENCYGDVFEFKPGKMYDYIYFDIWDSMGPESYLGEMPTLISRYSGNLRPDDKPFERIHCWGQEDGNRELLSMLEGMSGMSL